MLVYPSSIDESGRTLRCLTGHLTVWRGRSGPMAASDLQSSGSPGLGPCVMRRYVRPPRRRIRCRHHDRPATQSNLGPTSDQSGTARLGAGATRGSHRLDPLHGWARPRIIDPNRLDNHPAYALAAKLGERLYQSGDAESNEAPHHGRSHTRRRFATRQCVQWR